VSTGVVGKQGGVETSAHCRAGLHEEATKSTDFAVIKVQRTPCNVRGDRRACRTDLAADCLSTNNTLIKPAKQFVYNFIPRIFAILKTTTGRTLRLRLKIDFDTDLTPDITRHSCIISAELVVSSFINNLVRLSSIVPFHIIY